MPSNCSIIGRHPWLSNDMTKYGYIYGNDPTPRRSVIHGGAFRSWIDYETSLPEGKLQTFYFYVHTLIKLQDKIEDNSYPLYLQIWRESDEGSFQFYLVWSQLVIVNTELDTTSGSLYSVSFRVHKGI